MKNENYKKNQKIIATIEIEDKGQDFIKIDVLENGIMLGNSIIFENGRMLMVGVGTVDKKKYWTLKEIKENLKDKPFAGFYVYIFNINEPDPSLQKIKVLNYKIINIKKSINSNRFIK